MWPHLKTQIRRTIHIISWPSWLVSRNAPTNKTRRKRIWVTSWLSRRYRHCKSPQHVIASWSALSHRLFHWTSIRGSPTWDHQILNMFNIHESRSWRLWLDQGQSNNCTDTAQVQALYWTLHSSWRISPRVGLNIVSSLASWSVERPVLLLSPSVPQRSCFFLQRVLICCNLLQSTFQRLSGARTLAVYFQD